MTKNKNGSSSAFILILVLVAIVVGAGLYAYINAQRDMIVADDLAQTKTQVKTSKPVKTEPVKPAANPDEWATYANAALKFRISYPQQMSVTENADVFMPSLKGTRFGYPTSYTAGTNLTSAAVYATSMSGACPTVWSGVRMGTQVYTFGGHIFTKTTVSDSAMGGARSNEDIYTMAKDGRCYVLGLAVQYRDIDFLKGAGVVNPPKAFDQAAIDSVFSRMTATFAVTN